MQLSQPTSRGSRVGGFTMVEILVSSAILGTLFVAMYASIGSGFRMVILARENLRATQIMVEKMEEFRTYTWTDLSSGGTNIPSTFTARFFPTNAIVATTENLSTSGIIYTGLVSIAAADMTESYGTNLRVVTIELKWKSGATARSRNMQTYVSQYGMQNYLY